MAVEHVDLTSDQLHAIARAVAWYDSRNSQPFRIVGAAGTGKSTVARFILDALGTTTQALAPTNRAARILRTKGVDGARTIHSVLFQPTQWCWTNNHQVDSTCVQEESKHNHGPRFFKRVDPPKDVRCFTIDEASMVGKRIGDDVALFGIKTIVIGDPYQLPPVGDDPAYGPDLPGVELEISHRFDMLSDIGKLANIIRLSQGLADWKSQLPYVGFEDVGEYDLLLAWRNETRWQIITTLRSIRGLPLDLPRVGDRLISVANNYEVGVLNADELTVCGPITQATHMGAVNIPTREKGVVMAWKAGFKDFEGERWASQQARRKGSDICALTWSECLTVHKCVHPDTLVETPLGLQKISDIPVSGLIATPVGMAEYHSKFTRANGPTIRIGTRHGYDLAVTAEHGMTVWRGGLVRVPAEELVSGDILRLRLRATIDPMATVDLPGQPEDLDVRAVQHVIPTELTGDLAELLGLMVADGTVFNSGFRLAKRYVDVVDRFELLVKSLFGYEVKRSLIAETPSAQVNSVQLSRWLASVGGMSPNQKSVPLSILRSSLDVQAAFLRGLFEDGTVNVKNNNVDHVEWATKFPDLASTVHTMLLRFGLIATKTFHSGVFSLYLYGSSARSFGEQIGFVSAAKNERLKRGLTTSETRDIIPVTQEETDCLAPWMSVPRRQNARARGYISRSTAKEMIEAGCVEEFLRDRLGWLFTTVTSLAPEESETICVTVPDGHRFLQNGFDGWNSQGGEWENVLIVDDLDKMRWAYKDEPGGINTWAYTAVTRASKKVDFIRIGDFPTGMGLRKMIAAAAS